MENCYELMSIEEKNISFCGMRTSVSSLHPGNFLSALAAFPFRFLSRRGPVRMNGMFTRRTGGKVNQKTNRRGGY